MNLELGEGHKNKIPIFFADAALMKALGYIPIDCQWWPMAEENKIMDPELQPKIIDGAMKMLEIYTFLRSIDALCAENDSCGLYVIKPYERKSLTSSERVHPFEKYC
jgi:hypothetical protein